MPSYMPQGRKARQDLGVALGGGRARRWECAGRGQLMLEGLGAMHRLHDVPSGMRSAGSYEQCKLE